MDTSMVIIISIFAWFVFLGLSILVANAGEQKSIGFWPAFFLSIFTSPIFAMLFVIASPPKPAPVEKVFVELTPEEKQIIDNDRAKEISLRYSMR